MSKIIFVCDDNEEFLGIISGILKKNDYICDTFTTASSMITALHIEKPLCIFIDYFLRDMTAEEAIASIRAASGTQDFPVILCSAVQNCAELCNELHAFDHLSKPFIMQQIMEKIRAVEEIKDANS